MTSVPNYQVWQTHWGSPSGFFVADRTRFQVMAVMAILIHSMIFGLLWKVHLDQKAKAAERVIELQNVDLITPESDEPPAPPPVEVQKPKSAFEFLKMAIPIFHKPAAPEIRDVAPPIKFSEPKIAEPEKLNEKKFLMEQAPQIKLDKTAEAPKIADLSRIPQMKSNVPLARDPSIKLEEVGRRAVQVPITPSISLDRNAANTKMADLSAIPRQSLAPRSPQAGERLMERAPSAYAKPAAPLGYQPRGGSVSLDTPRDIARASAKPAIETAAARPKAQESAVLSISKEKVKITGPLSSRKVVKSYVPEYPSWARSQNVEADVAIRFTVSPSGEVSGNPVIERTSGHTELDRISIEALKLWRFSPLSGAGSDQWGVITFRFRLD